MNPRPVSEPDPARSLALLWGAKNRPGRSGLTIQTIVQAAIEIAVADGFAAVSMRRVAERVGVGVMSLYTHIPRKEDLAALMIDTAYGELYDDGHVPNSAEGGWRGGLEFVASSNWDLFQSHPWLLEAIGGRPVLGPNEARKYEAELQPLDDIGLSDIEMDAVLSIVLTHVEAAARTASRIARTEQSSGVTDAEWWVEHEPLITRLVDPEHFPVSLRVGQAAGEAHQAPAAPTYLLRLGLDLILEGVEALLAERRL